MKYFFENERPDFITDEVHRLHDEAHQPHEKHLPYPQPWEFVYDQFFSNVKNKFFIDVGASNGVDGSNSSLFEFYLNWNGIVRELY